MYLYQTEDISWAQQRLRERVSFSGWSFATIAGLLCWVLLFRIVM